MDYFDLIKELRKGEPNIKKAEKAMKTLGWICFFGAIWNFIVPLLAPSEKNFFNFPKSYPIVALVSLSIVGILFFFSSRGIRQRAQWGVWTAQIAIILVLAIMVAFVIVCFFSFRDFLPEDSTFLIIMAIVFTLVFGQFLILGFFGIQYLGRLPVKETTVSDKRFGIYNEVDDNITEVKSSVPWQAQTYKDALFPFGIGGTFALLVAGLLIMVFAAGKYFGEPMMTAIFLPGFAFIFLGPMVYNKLPSPFEKDRELIASYTGGGSIAFFRGSWPFFKLIVYKDGLEVRVMFHRFFIPFEHMEDIPEKLGFFSRGIPIKSDLPDVPSSIRFMPFGMKKVNQTIIEAKAAADLLRTEHENPKI